MIDMSDAQIKTFVATNRITMNSKQGTPPNTKYLIVFLIKNMFFFCFSSITIMISFYNFKNMALAYRPLNSFCGVTQESSALTKHT